MPGISTKETWIDWIVLYIDVCDVCIYIYIIYIFTHTHICIYTRREREKGGGREGGRERAGSDVKFQNLKSYSQWHTSYNKATSFNNQISSHLKQIAGSLNLCKVLKKMLAFQWMNQWSYLMALKMFSNVWLKDVVKCTRHKCELSK